MAAVIGGSSPRAGRSSGARGPDASGWPGVRSGGRRERRSTTGLKGTADLADVARMEWIRFAVRVRSRQIVLAVIAAGFVIAIAGPKDSTDPNGLAAVVSFFAGLAILGVVACWRRFWRGGTVFELRMRTDPVLAAQVAAMAPDGAAVFMPEGDPTPGED